MGLIVADRWSVVNQHFADRLSGLPHSAEAIAYVVGVLGKRRWDSDDLSRGSVVLAYKDASDRGDFVAFQRIGDWVLFADIMLSPFFEGVRDSVENVGRLSYYRCFRLMGDKWRVFEELADDLPKLVVRVRQRLV